MKACSQLPDRLKKNRALNNKTHNQVLRPVNPLIKPSLLSLNFEVSFVPNASLTVQKNNSPLIRVTIYIDSSRMKNLEVLVCENIFT